MQYSDSQVNKLLEKMSVIDFFSLKLICKIIYFKFCIYLFLYHKNIKIIIEFFENSTGIN